MSKFTADDRRKYLVCERYKINKNSSYQALNLLPLRKDERYGHLFLGVRIPSKSLHTYPALDESMFVWRFTPKGIVERAKITEDLEGLNFEETDYDFCSQVEEKRINEIFGLNTDKYLEVMEQYGAHQRGRIQKFVSRENKLDELKRYAVNNPQKIATLLVAGTLAVSGGVAGIAHLAKGAKNHVSEPITTPPPIVTANPVEEAPDYIITEDGVTVQVDDSALQFTPAPTKVNYEHSISRVDRVSDSLFEDATNVKKSGNTSTMEYQFFHKYFSAVNPELQDTGKGEFASVEEMLSAYEKDPQRFAIYGKRFLESMSLDYMKIQVAKTYGISDPQRVMITYENPEGAFEIRVRENLGNGNKRDLELPGYGYVWNTEKEGMKHLEKLITGSRNRYTRLPMSEWEYFLEINEAEHYSDYFGRTRAYYQKDYNNFMFGFVEDMAEKVGALEQTHMRTVAQEHDMDDAK